MTMIWISCNEKRICDPRRSERGAWGRNERDVGRGKAWVGAGWTHVGGFVVFGWVRARGCALRVAIVRDAFRAKSVHFEDILASCVSKILWDHISKG